ncbi:MAG: ATP-binding cassette domain-containing protein, partial [Gammaproteobacteria bacterium]|nr:ATP-binding cassette domain-containing protein [Gammaproteobacteria bacterium]
MNIVRLVGAELAYGEQKLLSDASFVLQAGEKVALIGRNGIGKSTLLKLLQGEVVLDDGELWVEQGLRVAALHQSVPDVVDQTIFDIIKLGIYNIEPTGGEADEVADWNIEHRVEKIIDVLELPGEKLMSECSGGLRRRAMLGQALVGNADLLLLDEPTNHLEIAAIDKLQDMLLATTTTVIMVSHDRALVDKVASRIVELDRGTLISYPGNYAEYLVRKQLNDEIEATANKKFDRNLAQEEVWIRQGIKARRTRNEGRVRRLQSLRKERSARVLKQGSARLSVDAQHQSGSIV